jgi:hypothetical protein
MRRGACDRIWLPMLAVGAFLSLPLIGCGGRSNPSEPERYGGGATVGAAGAPAAVPGTGGAYASDDGGKERDSATMPEDRGDCADAAFIDRGGGHVIADVPELSVSDITISPAGCTWSVMLSAMVVNDSPFGLEVPVAFYHSDPNVLIGVAYAELMGGENEPELMRVDLVWKNPVPHEALITVVADDDGTGRSTIREHNESDNTRAATLPTCPTP